MHNVLKEILHRFRMQKNFSKIVWMVFQPFRASERHSEEAHRRQMTGRG